MGPEKQLNSQNPTILYPVLTCSVEKGSLVPFGLLDGQAVQVSGESKAGREPGGQPHGHCVPWTFQQTHQTSGKLRAPGALLDGFPIRPPNPCSLSLEPGFETGRRGSLGVGEHWLVDELGQPAHSA